MSKYNVGDKVLVRSDLADGGHYFMEDDSENGNIVTSEMLELCGTVVTIEGLSGSGQYFIKEGAYKWTDGMFVGRVNDAEESKPYESFFDFSGGK